MFLKVNPRFIILVAAPENLTPERLSRIGYILKKPGLLPRTRYYQRFNPGKSGTTLGQERLSQRG